jgi:hypothetical protein
MDNAFAAVSDPGALQRICDQMGPGQVDALLRKWLARLPHPFTAAGRACPPCCATKRASASRAARSRRPGVLWRPAGQVEMPMPSGSHGGGRYPNVDCSRPSVVVSPDSIQFCAGDQQSPQIDSPIPSNGRRR